MNKTLDVNVIDSSPETTYFNHLKNFNKSNIHITGYNDSSSAIQVLYLGFAILASYSMSIW